MKWGIPPIIKIYEALGTVADDRIEINGLNAKVYSSSRKKYYSIKYDPETNSIMANDNASYYIGYLGYPSIAFLMKIGELDFSEKYSKALEGIRWKDINVKFKNDFSKTQKYVDDILVSKGVDLILFHTYLDAVLNQIKSKDLNLLGEKEMPPKGY
jgi:hypothetical protein